MFSESKTPFNPNHNVDRVCQSVAAFIISKCSLIVIMGWVGCSGALVSASLVTVNTFKWHVFWLPILFTLIRSFVRSFVRSFFPSFLPSFLPSFIRSFIVGEKPIHLMLLRFEWGLRIICFIAIIANTNQRWNTSEKTTYKTKTSTVTTIDSWIVKWRQQLMRVDH